MNVTVNTQETYDEGNYWGETEAFDDEFNEGLGDNFLDSPWVKPGK